MIGSRINEWRLGIVVEPCQRHVTKIMKDRDKETLITDIRKIPDFVQPTFDPESVEHAEIIL